MTFATTLSDATLVFSDRNSRLSHRPFAEPEEKKLDLITETVLFHVGRRLSEQRHPRAMYRLQLSRNFTFRQAIDLVAYWNQLGISDCYASPYLQATAGSSHGYDVVNHESLNSELGSNEDFKDFVDSLRSFDMGHILDFVPNHMGIASNENVWFQDVLENGPSSKFASFFDIDWNPLKSDLQNKILLPVLGQQFGQVLEDQQLVLVFQSGTFLVHYYNRYFPIAPGSFSKILGLRLDELEVRLGPDHPRLLEYHSILTAISHLPPRIETAREKLDERDREKEVIKRRLQRLCDECSIVNQFVVENVQIFNGRKGEPRSFDLLDDLLQDQAYRLAFWHVAADEINYRRFFDINELAAICIERPEVFDRTHTLVWKLLETRQVDGMRIDHADGLYDPTGYLWQLQERRFLQLCRIEFDRECLNNDEHRPPWNEVENQLRRRFAEMRVNEPNSRLLRSLYLVVEKILQRTERLPHDWPVHGSTGYEFLNELNGLFVDGSRARVMDGIYTKFIGRKMDFRELTYDAKRLILKVSMFSELHVLGHQLDRISERNRWTRDFTLHGLIQALREVIACFPIYRTYTVEDHVLDRDRGYIEQAVTNAKHRNPAVSAETFDFIRELLLRDDADSVPLDERILRQQFVGRFQQFTSPMMAKAVEDTAFYRYNRLISLNEVGGDPERFGLSVAEFHQRNRVRQERYPRGLLATSTHDTKRSEDVRARINVLSEIPGEWRARAMLWARLNKSLKTNVDGELAPSKNDEYLLYQTLLGAWPLDPPRDEALTTFVDRIRQYMIKSVREAKVFSSWIAPNQKYEQALKQFIECILTDRSRTAFRSDFEHFARLLAYAGFWNSLSQTLIKLTSPGVPDIYQGTELWDYSLVDPDNRRPVDFEYRKSVLAELAELNSDRDVPTLELARHLMSSVEDGRIKLFLISQVLRFRNAHPQLFDCGSYLPIEVQGPRRDNVIAYARIYGNQSAIVVAPRLCASQTRHIGCPPTGLDFWRETRIVLPGQLVSTGYHQLLTDQPVPDYQSNGGITLSAILTDLPVAFLVKRSH